MLPRGQGKPRSFASLRAETTNSRIPCQRWLPNRAFPVQLRLYLKIGNRRSQARAAHLLERRPFCIRSNASGTRSSAKDAYFGLTRLASERFTSESLPERGPGSPGFNTDVRSPGRNCTISVAHLVTWHPGHNTSHAAIIGKGQLLRLDSAASLHSLLIQVDGGLGSLNTHLLDAASQALRNLLVFQPSGHLVAVVAVGDSAAKSITLEARVSLKELLQFILHLQYSLGLWVGVLGGEASPPQQRCRPPPPGNGTTKLAVATRSFETYNRVGFSVTAYSGWIKVAIWDLEDAKTAFGERGQWRASDVAPKQVYDKTFFFHSWGIFFLVLDACSSTGVSQQHFGITTLWRNARAISTYVETSIKDRSIVCTRGLGEEMPADKMSVFTRLGTTKALVFHGKCDFMSQFLFPWHKILSQSDKDDPAGQCSGVTPAENQTGGPENTTSFYLDGMEWNGMQKTSCFATSACLLWNRPSFDRELAGSLAENRPVHPLAVANIVNVAR
ncbi:hypothetical protein JRQ81_006667 [Phrynocephalus forsythii]|uniref:ILEI/PANDER domain-containing protein n=1 Tax=Phrynocephalus forsythii TaxID=171643 RepID=A0A9Q0XFD7_9SAUR|nr:hypothetical protein JRQ81_006667 [Phrynocephalus forsythii]